MWRKSLIVAAVAAALCLTTVSFAADTADDVIAKYLVAIGGKDKMKAVKSMRMSGKMTVGPGMEAPFMMEVKRPMSMRMEFTFQGMTGIQAFDGTQGWMIMPFMGSTDPQPIPPEALKDAQEQADFEGPLVDYKDKGHQVELVGKEPVEGTDAYKLKVTLKNGDVVAWYLEAESFLPIKQEAHRTVQGNEVDVETSMGDFREVEGLKFPFALESKVKGMPAGQALTIDKIELNPEVADDRFKMPAKPKAEEPAPTEKGGGQ